MTGVEADTSKMDLLGVYLNDHLAGALGGFELAEAAYQRNQGSDVGAFLSELRRHMAEDHDTLDRLIVSLGLEPSRLKQAGAWLAEKVSRFKLGDDSGNPDLRILLELETLALGVRGKLLMWQALEEVKHIHEKLAATDFDSLKRRAGDQLAGLERHRREAARRAFGG